MDLSFSLEEKSFQMEVRSFIANYLTVDVKRAWR